MNNAGIHNIRLAFVPEAAMRFIETPRNPIARGFHVIDCKKLNSAAPHPQPSSGSSGPSQGADARAEANPSAAARSSSGGSSSPVARGASESSLLTTTPAPRSISSIVRDQFRAAVDALDVLCDATFFEPPRDSDRPCDSEAPDNVHPDAHAGELTDGA